MSQVMQRHTADQNVVVGATEAASGAIDYSDSAGGTMQVPSTASYVTLTFYSCRTADGIFLPVYDSSNAAVTRTVAASRAYALPDELFGSKWIKIVGDAAGLMGLSLKS